jgi:putative salt-induced outer membrane protein
MKLALTTLMIFSLVATAAQAQDSATIAPKVSPKDSVKAFTAVVNLGFLNASGNTSVTTLTAGDEITIHHHTWTYKQVLAYVYGKNDSVETANQLAIGLRAERAFGPRWGIYLGARYYRDPFAGIDQRFGEQLGALYHAIIAPKDMLDLEAGLGYTQERSTAGVENDFPDGRFAATYRHSWTKKTYFQESAEILPDLSDSRNYRVNSLTELLAPLSSSISMRFAYAVAYNNQPAKTFKASDRTLTAGVQLAF